MEDRNRMIDSLFKKFKPETAIKLIRRTFWKAESDCRLLEYIINVKEKENITMEEAVLKIKEKYEFNREVWNTIRDIAEKRIEELGIDCPKPKITTTISDGYITTSETTEL